MRFLIRNEIEIDWILIFILNIIQSMALNNKYWHLNSIFQSKCQAPHKTPQDNSALFMQISIFDDLCLPNFRDAFERWSRLNEMFRSSSASRASRQL